MSFESALPVIPEDRIESIRSELAQLEDLNRWSPVEFYAQLQLFLNKFQREIIFFHLKPIIAAQVWGVIVDYNTIKVSIMTTYGSLLLLIWQLLEDPSRQSNAQFKIVIEANLDALRIRSGLLFSTPAPQV